MERGTLGGLAVEAGARLRAPDREAISFRKVNRRSSADYQPDMQRHHLLPRQVMQSTSFQRLFEQVGRKAIGFDDFRANGLLLPCSSNAALRTGLPLHRGPHRAYNQLVEERVGQIESGWALRHVRDCRAANDEAYLRLRLLQGALRRRLMQREKGGFILNRKDPFRAGVDFTELDAMVELLWSASEPRA